MARVGRMTRDDMPVFACVLASPNTIVPVVSLPVPVCMFASMFVCMFACMVVLMHIPEVVGTAINGRTGPGTTNPLPRGALLSKKNSCIIS
jgi:hypothetical protein